MDEKIAVTTVLENEWQVLVVFEYDFLDGREVDDYCVGFSRKREKRQKKTKTLTPDSNHGWKVILKRRR